MGYKYETHLHTCTASACGRSKGSEYISYYKERGYDGIFVSDHFYLGNTCVDRNLPWPEWVRLYCDGWREAKEEGDRQGLKVFFAWETSYAGEDFLIYGLDEQWLIDHPDIRFWDQREQYEHCHGDGALVVQAHPFRERNYQNDVKIHPYHSDAWEIANAGNTAYQDILAYEYAKAHGKLMTAGSDIHSVNNFNDAEHFVFGIETEKPLESAQDYVALIKSGKGWKNFYAPGRMEEEKQNPWFDVFEYSKDHERILISGNFFEGAPKAKDPH